MNNLFANAPKLPSAPTRAAVAAPKAAQAIPVAPKRAWAVYTGAGHVAAAFWSRSRARTYAKHHPGCRARIWRELSYPVSPCSEIYFDVFPISS